MIESHQHLHRFRALPRPAPARVLQLQVRIRVIRRCICIRRHRRLQADYRAYTLRVNSRSSTLPRPCYLCLLLSDWMGNAVIRAGCCEQSNLCDPCHNRLDLIGGFCHPTVFLAVFVPQSSGNKCPIYGVIYASSLCQYDPRLSK